jgi:hypothetical protein
MKQACIAIALGAAGFAAWGATPRAVEVKDKGLQALIARSKVWRPTDIAAKDLFKGPQGDGFFKPGETIACDYLDKKMSGGSPKFACRLPDGDELKVKYGGDNGEVYAEVIATRLLWALGFGADNMYSVRVVCHGCPDRVGGIEKENGDRILDPAAVERKMAGEELLGEWAWTELESIDETQGGATKAERDALKLLASLIQHSDSKPVQQRLICLDRVSKGAGACEAPMMMINDVGITFGRANAFNQQPRGSANLAEWAKLPVWKDAGSCVANITGSVSGTLKEPIISEAGRQFLADLLMKLTDRQLRDMFQAARIQLRPRAPEDGRSGFPAIDEWVAAFKQKRQEIVDHRCPA